MKTLLNAISAEFLKIFSTRMWWILAVILFVYIAFSAGGGGALFGYLISEGSADPGQVPPGLDAATLPMLVYSFGTSIGYVFPIILGALAVTSEFRHQTLTPTFLATPKRGLVLLAKVKVLFVMGALLGVVAMLASVGAGAIALSAFGINAGLGEPEVWAMIGRAVLAMALWSIVGVGLGTLVPSQVAAIVIVLAFTQFVEPILRFATAFIDWTAHIGKFLPGAASDALVGASFFSLGVPAGATLEWWQGGLVLAGIALIVLVLGNILTWRKDVT